jgi:hypothetical protein
MRSAILAGLVGLVGLALAACGGDEAINPDGPPGGPDAGPCAAPLDQATLDALTHSFWPVPSVEIQPGQERDIELGIVELGAAFSPRAACATWSIAPAGAGATVDPATGTVRVDPGTPSGTEYVVTADVESGRKLITADVFVYVQAEMPWHGIWREQAQLACGSGAEVAPEEMLNEIYFWADGTLWVTWLPFEVYVDYWGTHAFDTSAGTLAITASGGNYVPTDIEGAGTFAFDGPNLILEDMWLGSPQGSTMPARCGHKLMR